MTQGAALYLPAKQVNTRAENHFDGGLFAQHLQEARDGSKRRGEVGVPETYNGGIKGIERVEHAAADSFGFAAIPIGA